MLTVIITTSCSVNTLVSEHGFEPTIIVLKPLMTQESVELFLHIAGDITAEEVFQLMLEDQTYPIQKLIHIEEGGYVRDRVKMMESHRAQIMKKLEMPESRGMIQALGMHDLFRHLSGNRQSISLVAAFHK